ncbi:universal stress protein [Actinocorallia libanotica]|uniref:UspA domain-containing protein n=1 Tax=Actinocorallia libanotica TaxID=46162 RepID=A0ABN1QIL8_9ACTN
MDQMTAVILAFAAAWIITGLVTGLWLARRGHSLGWTVVAVVLGPWYVPIALDRVERSPGVATFKRQATDRLGERSVAEPQGLRVLTGFDGSSQSCQAIRDTVALLGPRCGELVIAEAVTYDDADDPTGEAVENAARRLAAAVAETAGAGSVSYQVLFGPPGEALLRFAEAEDVDLLVVGRHGRGMSARLLGNVPAYLVKHATIPVLVANPRADRYRSLHTPVAR